MSRFVGRSLCFKDFPRRRKMNNPIRVSHLKNSIWVRKGMKESGKLEAEGSDGLKAEGSMFEIDKDWRRA
jgi:hypothetical protein